MMTSRFEPHVALRVRAKMHLLIKRLLRKYKYPPEGQEHAIAGVIQQAEALADEWGDAK